MAEAIHIQGACVVQTGRSTKTTVAGCRIAASLVRKASITPRRHRHNRGHLT